MVQLILISVQQDMIKQVKNMRNADAFGMAV
jgi:hypothetical protein